MSDDIILLSSDDECESPPPKKIKPAGFEFDVFEKLNKLTDIIAVPCPEKKQFVQKIEESRLTIVIESDEKSKENENNIVNLTDESLEECADEQKDVNTSSDCLIVASDSETEENLAPPPNPSSPKQPDQNREEQNGIEQNGHANHETSPELEPKPALKTSTVENDDLLNRPSTSKASDAHKLLDEFLETCAKSLKGSKYESKVLPKFPKIKNNFDKCDSIHGEPNLRKMLQEYISTAKISAPEAVVAFQRMYSYLLDNINGDAIEVPEEHLKKLKILEKTCKKLLKRLKILENAEVNFEDEDDSTYMQIDRYSKRLNQVYAKYCQLLERSPYAGRLLHERIQFVSSKYNEINRAITKSYKNNKFPSYHEIEKCIRKCVAKHNLGLSEGEIKEESKQCFTKMGNLLQMRRKKELYEVHCGFIALNEDPANTDENLKSKLQDSLQEGDKKMKQVVDKYAQMQENNVSVELSEDSDDSNYKESDSEPEV
ncbi:death domain-associated protein 6-like isoform X2 [Zophobas morio]|uniref:death domain-associated protein 6-like isoform X2 n=1 Tax=Zophobas morio TaxID=2755281 RepID=UPI003082747D